MTASLSVQGKQLDTQGSSEDQIRSYTPKELWNFYLVLQKSSFFFFFECHQNFLSDKNKPHLIGTSQAAPD